jgi:hypothetical protein
VDWFALVDVGAISSQSSSRACMSLYCSACRRVIDREGRAATLALNEIAHKEESWVKYSVEYSFNLV